MTEAERKDSAELRRHERSEIPAARLSGRAQAARPKGPAAPRRRRSARRAAVLQDAARTEDAEPDGGARSVPVRALRQPAVAAGRPLDAAARSAASICTAACSACRSTPARAGSARRARLTGARRAEGRAQHAARSSRRARPSSVRPAPRRRRQRRRAARPSSEASNSARKASTICSSNVATAAFQQYRRHNQSWLSSRRRPGDAARGVLRDDAPRAAAVLHPDARLRDVRADAADSRRAAAALRQDRDRGSELRPREGQGGAVRRRSRAGDRARLRRTRRRRRSDSRIRFLGAPAGYEFSLARPGRPARRRPRLAADAGEPRRSPRSTSR